MNLSGVAREYLNWKLRHQNYAVVSGSPNKCNVCKTLAGADATAKPLFPSWVPLGTWPGSINVWITTLSSNNELLSLVPVSYFWGICPEYRQNLILFEIPQITFNAESLPTPPLLALRDSLVNHNTLGNDQQAWSWFPQWRHRLCLPWGIPWRITTHLENDHRVWSPPSIAFYDHVTTAEIAAVVIAVVLMP